MQPSEIIREALNLMFERGHAKKALEGPDGSLCAVGACLVAEHGTVDTWRNNGVRFNLRVLTALAEAAHHDSIVWFNDAQRTFDEIVDWFHRAEKIAEQREHAS